MTTDITAWPYVGVEISADRLKTWVARAAVVGDLVYVDLLEAIPGSTDATVAVLPGYLQAWGKLNTRVAVDPNSPSSTLADRLDKTGLRNQLRLPNASDLALAHGTFLDLLAAGRLRISGDPAIDTAARHAQERRLSGAHAVNRYEGEDPATLVAAELAVWLTIAHPDYDVLQSAW